MQIAAVKLPVTDIALAAPFYRDVLGLTEEFAAPEYGWAQYVVRGMPLCLYVPGMGGGEGTPGAFDSLHLAVADLEAAAAQVRARGGEIPGGLHRGDDGTAFFDLCDPDGNRIKVLELPA